MVIMVTIKVPRFYHIIPLVYHVLVHLYVIVNQFSCKSNANVFMNLVKLIKCGVLLSGGSAEENFRPNSHRCGDHQISVNQHEKGHSEQNN